MRLFIEQLLRGLGYQVVGVSDGEAGLDLLERSPQVADIILLDRTLPGIDGTEFINRCRADNSLRVKPIIMLTGSNRAADIRMGVDAGVFYYLVKPVEVGVLQSVVASAMRRVESNRKLLSQIDACRGAMNCVQSAKFRFRTPAEAQMLTILLSGSFPVPERVIIGISELMSNAIEHGNLEIGFDHKCELLEKDALSDEIERRLQLEPYSGRVAEALVTKKPDGTYVVITDAGRGFDPRAYMNLDPARAMKRSGRGIAQARTISFDKLTYNKTGNQVMGFVSCEETIDW
jgi:DNA-binding response OmpR family regulator/anti-sigma regulatory factor (Ser/Thr protein kinase)